jgi:hypothetical protein
MTRPPLTPLDEDNIDISKVHKFAPAQIGDEAVERRPPWWGRHFWRGLFRVIWFCALVFVIAYLATLIRNGAA